MPVDILPADSRHLDAITTLHLENLPSPFRGKAGKELLRLYYKTISRGLGGCGFVAVENNRVAGYICGVWDKKVIRKCLISAYWLQLIFWSAVQSISHPRIVLDFIRRLTDSEYEPIFDGYELRPIVVSNDFRGKNISSLLLNELLKDARQRGFHSIHLYTEENNAPALRFYQKSGFQIVGQTERSGIKIFLLSMDIL